MARVGILPALIVLAVAGCIGAGPPASDDADTAMRPGASEDEAGTLLIEVTDAGLDPIEGATVEATANQTQREAQTGSDGQVRWEAVPAGSLNVRVSADGHHAQQRNVTVPAGDTASASFALETATTGPWTQSFEFNGFFECSATYLIITGDCLAPARAATQQAGLGPDVNATNHRFTFPFEIQEGWETLRIEQTWEDGELTAGSMMRVNLEPVEAGTEGHSPHFARTEGSSPLSMTLEAGQTHGTASDASLNVPEGPVDLRTRTFHLGIEETHQPAGTSFLGAGAAVQQPFTVLVEVTYR